MSFRVSARRALAFVVFAALIAATASGSSRVMAVAAAGYYHEYRVASVRPFEGMLDVPVDAASTECSRALFARDDKMSLDARRRLNELYADYYSLVTFRQAVEYSQHSGVWANLIFNLTGKVPASFPKSVDQLSRKFQSAGLPLIRCVAISSEEGRVNG